MFPAASPDPTRPVVVSTAKAIDRGVEWLIVLAYIALEIALFRLHAPWRDEAQAWLVAQALAQPLDFLVIPSEGHPPLWFWLLRGLSSVASFDQARLLTLGVAMLNAVLFRQLLQGRLLLLVLMLCSSVIVFSWGFHFRPYGIVLTLVLSALLLERRGRNQAATWCLAIACGLHFFAGFLFAFWLLVQLHRKQAIAGLILPALLGAVFGASALLSGLSNPAGAPELGNLVIGTLNNLAWAMPGLDLRSPVAGLVYVLLLIYALRGTPFILGALLTLTLGFAAGTAIIYGEFTWHAAFMMIMAFMAFMLAGSSARQWVLLLILTPQALVGIIQARNALGDTTNGDFEAYAMVQADAGQQTLPPGQLVAWPDFMLSPAAAREGFSYRSGNSGRIIGPVDWSSRTSEAIAPELATLPAPYWLVCIQCAGLLDNLTAQGREATLLGTTRNRNDGAISAYRID